MALRLVDESTGATLADQVELALDRASRRQGLLGRKSLPRGSALVLSPCWMVHTAFMKFDIDVLFVDARGCVVKVASALPSWQVAMSIRAHLVIELPANTAWECGIRIGDRVALVETGADPTVPRASFPLALEARAC